MEASNNLKIVQIQKHIHEILIDIRETASLRLFARDYRIMPGMDLADSNPEFTKHPGRSNSLTTEPMGFNIKTNK